MCGIVGLHLRDPELYPQLGRLLETMLCQVAERGPDSAGSGRLRRPPPGARRSRRRLPAAAYRDIDATSARTSGIGARRAAGRAGAGDHRSRRHDRRRGTGRGRRARRRGPAVEPGRHGGRLRDRPHRLQGHRPPAGAGRDVRPGQRPGLAGPRPHPDGHRVRGHPGGLPPLLRRRRTSAWCTTGPSPTTPRSAASCGRPGTCSTRENDSEVGARFVADRLAAGRGPGEGAAAALRALRRLLHPARHQRRRLRGRAGRDRLQARDHRRDRPRGWPWPRSSGRWPTCPASSTPASTSPSRSASTRGSAA